MNKKIMIIDDEREIAMTHKSFFGRRGFDVRTTGDGDEALNMIKDDEPDLVILDLKINGLQGQDVLKILQEKYDHIKVIIVTGTIYSEEKKEEFFKQGVKYIILAIIQMLLKLKT